MIKNSFVFVLLLLSCRSSPTNIEKLVDQQITNNDWINIKEISNLDPSIKNGYYRPPLLHVLCWNKKNDLVLKYLESGEDVTILDEINQWTALHVAIACDDIDTAKTLLKFRADVQATDVDKAPPIIYCRSPEVLALLLSAGAKINSVNRNHAGILHRGGLDSKMIEFIIRNGADINLEDCKHRTPLHSAVIRFDYTMAHELISRGALPNVKDNYGKTAIDYCNEIKDDLELIKIRKLLEKIISASH